MVVLKTTGKESTRRLPFPLQLYQMLEDADEKNFTHIVSWNSDGSGLFVHDRIAFTKYTTPQYFNQTKYKSFQRQLCLYGFVRTTSGKHKGCRFNKFFRKGDRNLCKRMRYVGTNSSCKVTGESSATSPPPEVRGRESKEWPQQSETSTQHCQQEKVSSSRNKDEESLPTPPSYLPPPSNDVNVCSSLELGPQKKKLMNNNNEIGVFEGMSFHVMAPKFPKVLATDENFTKAEQGEVSSPRFFLDPDLWASQLARDEKLSKAWELGFSFALSLPREELASRTCRKVN
jgi:hypothetical protein